MIDNHDELLLQFCMKSSGETRTRPTTSRLVARKSQTKKQETGAFLPVVVGFVDYYYYYQGLTQRSLSCPAEELPNLQQLTAAPDAPRRLL